MEQHLLTHLLLFVSLVLSGGTQWLAVQVYSGAVFLTFLAPVSLLHRRFSGPYNMKHLCGSSLQATFAR